MFKDIRILNAMKKGSSINFSQQRTININCVCQHNGILCSNSNEQNPIYFDLEEWQWAKQVTEQYMCCIILVSE